MRKIVLLAALLLASNLSAAESELYGIIKDKNGKPVKGFFKIVNEQRRVETKFFSSDRYGIYSVKLNHPGPWKIHVKDGDETAAQSYADPTRWDIKLK